MDKIQEFNELHTSSDLLFLGNAWDLLSALLLEKAGFKAIGTTSWGIANTLGFPDGERIPFEKHLAIIQAITENVNVPVSADIEAGYSEAEDTIIQHVLQTANVGVAGINIEDSLKTKNGLREIKDHCRLLTKMRTALDQNGFKNFFINARTDTYLQRNLALSETIERATAYVESGASGIFVPGLVNEDEIKEVSSTVKAPLNVLSVPGLTDCEKMKEIGVRRFSFGNAFSDRVIAYIEKNATQLLTDMDTELLYKN